MRRIVIAISRENPTAKKRTIFVGLPGMRLTRLFQIALLMLFSITGAVQITAAQKGSFIYLQSDEQQPFYVTVNGRNVSSSSIGYVILSKIPDGTLPLRIGFPNSNTVQDYDLKVAGNDQGYLIKNFGEKGWGLFNLQSLDVQISGVELGKRSKETAAQKAAQEKKIADSIQNDLEKFDAARKIDSLKKAVAAQEALIRKIDSLHVIELVKEAEKKAADSIKEASVAAEKAKATEMAAAKALAMQNALAKKDSLAKALTAKASKDPKKKGAVDKTKKVAPAAKVVVPVAATAALDSAITTNTVVENKEKPVKDEKVKAAEPKKEPVAKVEAVPVDKSKATVYTDGADTVKAYFNDGSIDKTATADDDTIVIKIPARPVKKIVDSVATETKDPITAAEKAEEVAEKKVVPVADKKFLDIEINHDSALIKPETKIEEPAAKVDSVLAEKVVSADSAVDTTKQVIKGGLTANNENTKIIAAPTDSANGAKQKETPPVVENSNDSSKGKKVVGLTSNNPNTKIVVVPTVPVENTPVEKPKVQEEKTEVITSPVEKPKEQAAKTDSAVASSSTTPEVSNLTCKELATEKDFFNVRKSMVMGADADEMIMAGKKAFKEKCYSTAQIRNLTVLFLSDADRYSFLDAAYPYTSDATNYASLSDLLKESYYLNRFKAMLK